MVACHKLRSVVVAHHPLRHLVGFGERLLEVSGVMVHHLHQLAGSFVQQTSMLETVGVVAGHEDVDYLVCRCR